MSTQVLDPGKSTDEISIIDDDDLDHGPGVAGGPPDDRKARRPRRRRRRRIVLLVMLVLLSPIGYSYYRALRYPGSAGVGLRTVEWVRDHGGGGLVDNIEVWYYMRQHPPTTGLPSGPFPLRPTAAETTLVHEAQRTGHLATLHPGITPTMRGEAQWKPGPSTPGHGPGIYTTWFRPDPAHPTLMAGVISIDQTAARLDLVAGTKQPGGGPWPGTSQVPANAQSTTWAAFNSGFLIQSSHGGFWIDGHLSRSLLDGRASLVIDRNGRASVGTWGKDLKMGPQVHAVRQNLTLIVDGAKPVSGLVHNWGGAWGSRKSQLEWVWRSGVGIDRQGHLIYVAGNHFTLQTLADSLVQAGAVKGMQLDIHNEMVSANLFTPAAHGVSARKLLPGMPRPARRYLQADQRDFFTVTARP
ncbi:MAG: hypothetical protein JWM05_1881 [Acidimicrobiales bacterium]|nr:hypothetical protein [Acidimicrobiales bacterium]